MPSVAGFIEGSWNIRSHNIGLTRTSLSLSLNGKGINLGGNVVEWFFGDFITGVGRRIPVELSVNVKEKKDMLRIMYRLNRRLVPITVLALVVVAFAFYGISSAQSGDEAAVRDTLLQSASSFEKNNLATATKVWANDESLTVFESGHANYGWADYRDHHLVPEMGEMKNTKYVLSDMKIHLAGKTAWATFKYTISADVPDNGKTRHVDGGGLGTAVLEKRDGCWQLVHWHSSAPRRASAAPPASKPD